MFPMPHLRRHLQRLLHGFLGAALIFCSVAFTSADELENMTLANWMRFLPDNTRLCDLSIPGTHDTASGPGWGTEGSGYASYARCQRWDVERQLTSGIRHFDIRLYRKYNKTKKEWVFGMAHGRYNVGHFRANALDSCKEFLESAAGSSEVIIMLISEEKKPDVDKNTNLTNHPDAQTPAPFTEILDGVVKQDEYKDLFWVPDPADFKLPEDFRGGASNNKPDAGEEDNDGKKIYKNAKWNDPAFPTLGKARGKIIIVHKKGKYGKLEGKRWYAKNNRKNRWYGPMSGGDHYKSGGGPASKSKSTVWLNGRKHIRMVIDGQDYAGQRWNSETGLMRRTGFNGQALDTFGRPYPSKAADYIQPRLFNFLFSGTGKGFGGDMAKDEDALGDVNWIHNRHTGVLHMDFPRERVVAATIAHNFHRYKNTIPDLMRGFVVPVKSGSRRTTLFNEMVGGMWLSNGMFDDGEDCNERTSATQDFLEHVMPKHEFTVFCIKNGDDRSKFGYAASNPRKKVLQAGFDGAALVVNDHKSLVLVTGAPSGSNTSGFVGQNKLKSAVAGFVANEMDKSLNPQRQAKSVRDFLDAKYPAKQDTRTYWGVVVEKYDDLADVGYSMKGTRALLLNIHNGNTYRYFVWGVSRPN